MHFIRKAGLGLAASLLVTVLSTFGILFAVYQVLHTPTALKRALQGSGVYQTVVGNALDQAQKEQGSEASSPIPVNDPAVRSVIQEAASPDFLQSQAEEALDAVYAWLRGTSPDLKITVELTDVKARLANGLGEYVQQHVATLPACAPGTAPAAVDPFNATCVPAGFDANKAATEAKNQIQNGEFLKDTSTLTAESIKTEEGKTLEQQLHNAPVIYQRVGWAVYGLGLVAVLLAIGVVFLSASWRSGLKKAAIILLSAGATSALLAWLSSFGLKIATEQLAKASGGIQPLQQSIAKVAELLVGDIRVWWMGYGIVLVVLGIAVLITIHFTKPKITKLPKDLPAKEAAVPASVSQINPQIEPNNKPKQRPTKRLVQ